MPKFVFPEKEVALAFSNMVAPLIIQTENNHLQKITLTKLRDTLLPKLLSGEITVPDAESQLADARETAHV